MSLPTCAQAPPGISSGAPDPLRQLRWAGHGLRARQVGDAPLLSSRISPRVVRLPVLARAASGAKSASGAPRDMQLVDPVMAKQLADEDMERRKEAARKQRFRDIEAFNGGWAVLGLTAALLGEATSGEGILGQLALYLNRIAILLEALESKL